MPISEAARREQILNPDKHAPLVLPRILAEMGARPSACREAGEMAARNAGVWIIDAEGELINAETKESPEEWCARQRQDRPHYWLAVESVGDVALEACGSLEEGVPQGSLKGRAKLLELLSGNIQAYRETLAAWAVTEGSLKPGKRPATADNAAEPEKKPSSRSFFDHAYSGSDKADRIAAFIKQHGTRAALEEARKCNADLAGRPLKRRP